MTLLIRTTSLTGFIELVTRLNGNPETLLRRFNIDPIKVQNLEGVLPYRAKINLIEEAARELECVDFGLRLAREQDLKMFGSLAAVALTAPTVGQALTKIIQYMQYYSPGLQINLDPTGDSSQFLFRFSVRERQLNARQHTELTLALANNVVRMLHGNDFRPAAVTMQAEGPLPHNRYREVFDAPVYFGCDHNALVLDKHHLERPLDDQDPALNQLLGEYISDALKREPMDLPHQVRQLIYRLLPTQRCNLQEVSNQLGLHKRTLQRRLSDHGIIFEDLLDEIRRERADSYMAEPEIPMTQIAALLGYREQSSFNRACRRWFGVTPMKRRNQVQTSALCETEN
ncbi:AraC family transcriptional regulator [Microbulbifer sp. SAOS-129_SWC]|uniref:AraC family transcriptional regulator n=1 Tax=Microbulbifer sp. SAOS-129_SWC TaxID=3145235 RepID=UPI0032172C01